MTEPDHGALMGLRIHTVRAVVHALDDIGGDQMLTVEAQAGAPRQSVPVHYPFGFASSVPMDGAVTVLHALGGDQADLVALPPQNPSQSRFGGLSEGQSVLYDAAGQRVHLRNGVVVEIHATSDLKVFIGAATVLELTGTLCTVNVDMTVNGRISATGDVVAGQISLQQHVHGSVQSGQSQTGVPQS